MKISRKTAVNGALAGAGAALLAGGIAAGCAHDTVTPAAAPAKAMPTSQAPMAPSSAPAMPTSQAPMAPSSTPAPMASGLGSTFTVTSTDSNGNPVSYDVTLTAVDQHAQPGPYETLSNPADHMAAARFTVTGLTGQSSDDANSDATAIGSDTTAYQPSFISVADGGNFSYGQFAVAPHETVSGWVSFEVPPGQSVASVQWSPGGMSDSHATWTVTP